MDPDTDNMFAGLKKKKKKTVQILETDDDAAAVSTKAAAEDPVRPAEKSADLTLPDEEPLDFSDLKKVWSDGVNTDSKVGLRVWRWETAEEEEEGRRY